MCYELTIIAYNVSLVTMANNADPKREAILEAAFTQFSRYGFCRTSMQDIAKETGTSRASLYSYFENKEEIFRCLSAELHERSLGDAESHLKSPGSLDLGSRVEAALIARLAPFQERRGSSRRDRSQGSGAYGFGRCGADPPRGEGAEAGSVGRRGLREASARIRTGLLRRASRVMWRD